MDYRWFGENTEGFEKLLRVSRGCGVHLEGPGVAGDACEGTVYVGARLFGHAPITTFRETLERLKNMWVSSDDFRD